MKIFGEFFGDPLKRAQKEKEAKSASARRPDANPGQWDALLANCDLVLARDTIADMHRMLNQDARKRGGDYIFKQEYVDALKAFFDNPTVETARPVLSVATPPVLQCFVDCSPGGSFYSVNRLLRERDTPPAD